MNVCSSDFMASLYSGKHRPWMLATTLFLYCTCIHPGTYFYLIEETRTFKSYGTYECILFGGNYNGRL